MIMVLGGLWVLGAIALTIAIALPLLDGLLSAPTQNSLALKTINETSRQVGHHFRRNTLLPTSLGDIQGLQRTVDPWGRDLVYIIIDSATYELRSLGADGIRSDDDVAREFDATDILTETSRPPR